RSIGLIFAAPAVDWLITLQRRFDVADLHRQRAIDFVVDQHLDLLWLLIAGQEDHSLWYGSSAKPVFFPHQSSCRSQIFCCGSEYISLYGPVTIGQPFDTRLRLAKISRMAGLTVDGS